MSLVMSGSVLASKAKSRSYSSSSSLIPSCFRRFSEIFGGLELRTRTRGRVVAMEGMRHDGATLWPRGVKAKAPETNRANVRIRAARRERVMMMNARGAGVVRVFKDSTPHCF